MSSAKSTAAVKNTRTTGVVYFVQKDGPAGPVKVGWTGKDEVKQRIYFIGRQDETLLLGTIDGTHFTERQVHRYLIDDHIGGEWYKPTKRVLDAAEGIGLERLTKNEDPFDNLPTGRLTKARGKVSSIGSTVSEKAYQRQQIIAMYESGASGFDTAKMLSLALTRFVREVRTMADEGYFNEPCQRNRRRALQNVAA